MTPRDILFLNGNIVKKVNRLVKATIFIIHNNDTKDTINIIVINTKLDKNLIF